jgi:hypothetical protein
VSPRRAARDRLLGTRWVHVFEEDTPAGAVYRREDAAIPLSRRPREQLELRPGGAARLFVPGPADRPVEQPATWREEGGLIVVSAREGGAELRIVERSPERLVVQTAGGAR